MEIKQIIGLSLLAAILVFLLTRFLFVFLSKRIRVKAYGGGNKILLWDAKKKLFCNPETGAADQNFIRVLLAPNCLESSIENLNFLCKITDIFYIGEQPYAEVKILASKAKLRVIEAQKYYALVELNGERKILSTDLFAFPLKANEEREVLLKFEWGLVFNFHHQIRRNIKFWNLRKILLPKT